MSQNVLFNMPMDNNPQQQYQNVNSQPQNTDQLQFSQFDFSSSQRSAFPVNQNMGNMVNNNVGGGGGGYAGFSNIPSTYPNSASTSGAPIELDFKSAFGGGGMPGELPLLEELGINFAHIGTKSLTVLNPMKPIDQHIMDDVDLAGPIIFCFLFGAFLLMSGKLHFGYVYGVAMLGCVSMYCILNLMSESGIDGYRTASVLGYCLLPMVLLSSISALLSLNGLNAFILSTISVLWCANSASVMFVTVLSMKDQRFLVAYPVALLYSAFALLAIF